VYVIGGGLIFSSLIGGVSRNPSVKGQLFNYAILGFALVESLRIIRFINSFFNIIWIIIKLENIINLNPILNSSAVIIN